MFLNVNLVENYRKRTQRPSENPGLCSHCDDAEGGVGGFERVTNKHDNMTNEAKPSKETF